MTEGWTPMTDTAFRDFVTTHVVLEVDPSQPLGEVLEKAIAVAFKKFDQVGELKSNAHTLALVQ